MIDDSLEVSRRAGAALLIVLALGAAVFAQAPLLKTPAEEARYTAYTQNEALAAFLSRADALSTELAVRTVGRSDPVRAYAPREIFLAVLSAEGASRPEDLNRSKPTILFIAAQHGNEQSAKEAALRLLRDLALGELRPLLESVNVLIMPQTNPYGNFFDVRANELGLDMNRDHVKLEAAGVRAIHRVFREWLPEVSLDIHEKGDDYYEVSIGCVSNSNIHARLLDYSRRVVLAEVERALVRGRVTFHEYLITDAIGSTRAAGVPDAARPGPRAERKRFSTTDLNDGRNGPGIYETLAFIQEGASRHDLETLAARTGWQYAGLRAFSESVAAHGPEILAMVREFRAALLEKAARVDPGDTVDLRMVYARDPAQPTLTIRAFERTDAPVRGILRVDKKAGEALLPQDVAPNPAPADRKIVTQVVENWFPLVEPTVSVVRPLGYLVPAKHLDVVETLLNHGIAVRVLVRDASIDVEAYDVAAVVPGAEDYLAPEKIEVVAVVRPVVAKAGDFYVACAQPAANLIPCLLEPQSEYGLIRYWKYHLVPEPGNIFAIFRVVTPPQIETVPYKGWR